jgi:hypothetical protein
VKTAVTRKSTRDTHSCASATMKAWTGSTKNQSNVRNARIEARTAGPLPRRVATARTTIR